MRVLVWNCRGVGSPLTIPQLKELSKLHSPGVVFLAETKNKKVVLDKVSRQLGFENLCTVEP